MVGDERFASASGLSSRTHPPGGSNPVATGGERSASRRTGSTLLVDLNTRRVVDLLPDRRADTRAAWLHPRRRRIKVVARDRSPEFARGVALGAPRGQAGRRPLAPAPEQP